MNKKRNSFLVKLIGLVCTLALVLGAVYVPVTLSAFAATIPVTPDETIKFSFEPAEDPALNNSSHKERAEDGFGCASWGMSVVAVDGANTIGMNWPAVNTWKQAGGYRLNNSNGVYRLEENSRYIVKFKLTLRSAPTPEEVSARSSNAYINLGYGFTGPAASGNQVNTMDAVLAQVAVSSGNVYTVTDISGTREVTPSDKWYDLTYVFTTPADFAGKNNSFGFFAMNIGGTEFYIDEVEVTKLGTNTGVVLANDPYNAETKVMTGTVGQDVELPTLVGSSADHTFLGWYADEERNNPIGNIKYTAETQYAYAKWRAPVTLTFKDAHNGTETPVNGYTGDAISFPANPVDTKNDPVKYLFDGWYTTEMFTQKYEETTFGSSDLTVYAKWLEKEKEFVQDFENYPYSDEVAADYGGGVIRYTNYEHFATPMEKIDDPTQSGRGKVVLYEWDPNMVKVNSDPETYNAATELDHRKSGCITMGDHEFTNGMQYIMYFDYYVEDIGAQAITMTTQNIYYNRGWNVGEQLATKTHSVTADDKDGKWHTGVVILTMKESTIAGRYIHALFRNSVNDKAKVYLDNFRFVPVQINEVIMTVNNGAVAPTEYVPVEKGAAFNAEAPEIEGRTFKGWYKDSGCSQKFTDTVNPNFNFTVYSRWSEVPENFQNYPYSTTNIPTFGQTVSIVKGDGVGHEDDAVAKFELDGDKEYAKDGDNITYWAARAGRDVGGHVIKLGNVVEGAVYKVSFWYKGDAAANVDSLIRLQTAHPEDCWTHGKTDTNEIVVTPNTSEWKKAEFLYTCAPKDPAGNGLFIRFNSLGKANDLNQLAIAYIDDILVEAIDKPYVIFDSQDGKLPQIVQGKAGDKINIPEGAYKLGYEFAGWYLDKEFTQPFTDTVFAEDTGITVYAKYVFADSFSESFENYSYDTTNIPTFGQTVSIIKGDGVGHEDDAVAKFELDGDKEYAKDGDNITYWAARAGRDVGGHVIKLGPVEEGEVYKVSFWYKGDATANVDSLIRLQTAHPEDCWTHGKTDTHEAVVTPSTSEWKKMEFLYTCTLKDPKGYGLFIRFNSLGKANDLNQLAIAYIDDIAVEKIQKPYVIFDALDGKEGTVVQGKVGQTIKVPAAPNKLGLEFAGWYLDKEFTQPFTNTVFAEGMGVTVYAKYDYAESFSESFEDYSYSTTNIPTFGESVSIIKSKGVGHEDNAAAKFVLDGDKIYSKDGNNVTYWAARAGRDIGGHVIKLGPIEEGEVYKVSFWYKGDAAANVNSLIRLQAAHPDDCWTYIKTDTHEVVVTPDTTEWQKIEFLYYATLKDPKGTGLFVRFNSLGKANDLNQLAIAYIDDIVVEKIQKPFVIFDALDGKEGTIVQGKVGEKINVPKAIYKLGYEFAGWYLDKEFTKPFTDTVFAEGMGVTVYAKYDFARKYSESFDNYSYDTNNEAIFGKALSIVKGKGVGHEDDAAVKFEIDSNKVYGIGEDGKPIYWASRTGMDAPGHIVKIGAVEDGEVYKVSFWYKGDPAANKESWIRLQTAHPETTWHNSKTDTTSVTVKPSTEWTKAEYIFYADLKDPTSTGLYFRFASLGGANKFDVHAIAYVDDVVVEKIEKPFVIFDAQNNKPGTIVQGKAGENIKYPATPKLVGMKFVGWYLDKEFTKPFTDTVFAEGMGITVYAKYNFADNFTVSFENVGVNRGKEDDYLFYRGGMGAVEKVGYKNSTGLFFDRTETTLWASTNALFEDGNQVIISNENKYYVTFKYCVTEQQSENGFLYLRAASPGNGWGSKHSTNKTFEDAGVICVDYPVPATAEVGKWYTAKLILDTSKIYVHTNEDGTKGDPKAFAAIYMYYRAGGGKVAVDDITFKKLPKGHQAYIVDNGGASSVPSYVSGPIGTSFRGQLPTNPQFENHLFKNYFRFDKSHNQAILEDKDMVFTKDNISLVTNWVRLHTVQDFEDYAKLMYTYAGYGPADFDYELYDAEKEGNSADNVTSGRYSIHRLGNSPYFENIQILSDDLKICADEKFTVTMKVKVGKHFHTDGAIKLVGCKSATYAWANSGSFHPIAIIADIADGEWHEVSYTFNSVERFLAIQTPGYVEIFIDDVVIDRADPEMPVSTPPEYTEYVQALRDADGNLIKVDTTSIDVGSIIDFSLYIGGFNVLPVLLIGGGVILVAAIVFVVLFVTKKRKVKKG